MKKLIIIITSTIFLTSCSLQKTYVLTNGEKITEKQYYKIIDETIKETLSKITPQEQSLLFDDVNITIDTINTIVPDTLLGN
jgi:hypothetical protein